MQLLGWIPRVLVALFLLAILSGCSSLLYYPSAELFYPPEKLHLRPEEFWIPIASHEPIYSWYFHTKSTSEPKAVVVLFHGNGQNLSAHYLPFVWLLDNGYDLFIFDYRGYGRSPGSPSPESTVEDGVSVLKFLYKKNPKLPIVLMGQSIGGAIGLRSALEVKKEVPIQLIVVDSSFVSYKSAARGVLSHHWLTWIFQPLVGLVLSDSMAPGGRVSELGMIPMIVIHGDQDEVIDFSLGEELYRLANDPKEFWKVPGGKHIDAFSRKDPEFRRRLLTKMDRLFCHQACSLDQ